jgi:hypothetical protein
MKHRFARLLVALLTAAAVGLVTQAAPAQASTGDYVLFVRQELPEARSIPRATIIKLGKTICKSLNVLTVGQVVASSEDSGLDNDEVAVLIVGAVWFICPKHKLEVQDWIEDNS